MIHSLLNGFNIIMYSGTYRKSNSKIIIHQTNGWRLTFKKDIIITFYQGVIHTGGKSRIGTNNVTTKDMILFIYLWNNNVDGYNTRNEYNSVRSNSTWLHSMVDNICTGVNTYDNRYNKCYSDDYTSLDLSNMDMNKYNNGDIVGSSSNRS